LDDVRPRWVICAQGNDAVGNEAVRKLAPRLAELGIGVKRLQLPLNVDVNAYACQSADVPRALASLLEEASIIVAHARDRAEPHGRFAPPVDDQPAKHVAMVVDELTGEPLPIVDKQSLETGVGWAPEPFTPASYDEVQGACPLRPEVRGEDIFFRLGEREYRVRGLAKNTSYEAMKINLGVKLNDQSPSGSELYHQDNVDMNAAKSRETFIRAACSETAIKEEILKRDLSRLLLKLEELQEENIRRAMEPKGPVLPGMSEAERDEALALLRDPKLLERILARR